MRQGSLANHYSWLNTVGTAETQKLGTRNSHSLVRNNQNHRQANLLTTYPLFFSYFFEVPVL